MSTQRMRVAVDAMGGDFAPGPIVEGAVAAAREAGVRLLLVGPRDAIARELSRQPGAHTLDISLADAADVIAMDEPATRVLRGKRGASIRVAADAVARGEAGALFSAGHTGASVLASLGAFGLAPGVDRPALAATIPTLDGVAVLLDVGANLECRPRHLLQFAVLGAGYARAVLGLAVPRVGLLSIGEEATKGNELTREAHRLLRGADLDFAGNVEARDLFSGHADVIVCDGVTGNVALKVSEGMLDATERVLADERDRPPRERVGALLWQRACRRFGQRLEHAEHGAAPLLGLRGLCVVGHGRSPARAVQSGVLLAARLAADRVAERLAEEAAAALARSRAGRDPAGKPVGCR